MKLSTNLHQRFLWITAGASLLGVVGCSDLPGTARSSNTAMYEKTSAQTLDSLLAYPHQGWDGGGGGQAGLSAGPAGSVGGASSGGHSSGR